MRFAAVITETRNVDFKEILDRHIPYLPECDVVVFSYNNRVDIDCINHRLERNINSLMDYNYLMTSQWVWDKLDYDKVLIFQNDSEILRHGIEEFFEWDYVGAPWTFQHHGGNGGGSIRDVGVMKEVLKKEPYSPVYGYEDVYFSNQMFHRGMNIAPREVCKRFSCETIFELGTLMCHAIDNYLSKEQCEQIRRQYKTQAV